MSYRARLFLAMLLVGGTALGGVAAGLPAWAAAAAGAVVGWLAALGLTARLRRVTSVAARYAAGDYSQPTHEFGRDEIGAMARAVDHAVRQLSDERDALSAERAHFDTMLASMIEGVLLVDADRRLVLANSAARRILDLPALDAGAGRHYKDLVTEPDVTALLASALLGEAPPTREVRIHRLPGRAFVATAARVDDESGGAVLVLHDVTDLRKADQIRRDFVANVSHELRTPLTAVRGYVEALIDQPADEANRRRFLDVIARHTLRMERLVHDLLRLARLDAGQEPLERTDVQLASVIGDVTTDMADALARRGQSVALDVAPDAARLGGDAGKLHDIFRNLIENASQYGPEGAPIDIQARRAGDRIVIEVADRGPGIPPADLTRVFERFYRADPSRARESGGTGLGLAIVRHLVQLHGGAVSAHLRDGGGTIVRVELPGA